MNVMILINMIGKVYEYWLIVDYIISGQYTI